MSRRIEGRPNVARTSMESAIGLLLLAGVVLSTVLVAAGLVWHWGKTSQLGMDYPLPKVNLFRFATAEARQAVAGELRPRLLVSLGITTLLLTPYLRVLASLLFFVLKERNWKYSLFTAFVLAALTYSLWLR